MAELQLTEAFASYGARLRSPRSLFSAEANDGSIVVSLWSHFFGPIPSTEGGGLRYTDHFSRMKHAPGLAEFQRHLQLALEEGRTLRLVIAHIVDSKEREKALARESTPDAKKTFDVKPKLVGRVVTLTDDLYVIDFQTRVTT